MARLASALLRICGWQLVGDAPDAARCVVIFAPHTSNWDFPIMLLVRLAFGRKVHYLGKHTLFRFPTAWFFRWTGGIPVDRSEPQRLVRTMAEAFSMMPKLWLAISPEGTRAKTDQWHRGFYYIALEARVPVLLAFIDAGRKQCGLGGLIHLSGDPGRDLARIRDFYLDKTGIVPERAGEIRFRAEDS